MAVLWSDDLLLGIAKLDHQHRKLVESQVRLEKALLGNPTEHQIYGYLMDILEYAREHFASEEAFMQPHADRLSNYDDHVRQHKEFVQLAMEFIERFRAEGATLGREVYAFIGTWTLTHIKVVDRTMCDELRALNAI